MTTETTGLDAEQRAQLAHPIAVDSALLSQPAGGLAYIREYRRWMERLANLTDAGLIDAHRRLEASRAAAWEEQARRSREDERFPDDDVPLGPPTAADYAHDIHPHAIDHVPY